MPPDLRDFQAEGKSGLYISPPRLFHILDLGADFRREFRWGPRAATQCESRVPNRTFSLNQNGRQLSTSYVSALI